MKKQNKNPRPKMYTLYMYTLSSDFKLTCKKVRVTERSTEDRFPTDRLYLSTGQYLHKSDIVDRNVAQNVKDYEIINALRNFRTVFSCHEITNVIECAETLLNDRITMVKANISSTKKTLASCKDTIATCRKSLKLDEQKLATLESMKVEVIS